MSNRAVSIKTRLLNLAKKEGIDFQLIIIRFLHERLLYRLSVSDYSQQLILKGGAFIYAMQGLKSRPTIDVDLLGTQISNDIEALCDVFRQICAVESEDEVTFIPESVVGELITQQDKYNGVRLYIDATFHTVRQRIQIDVGFGDIVIPVVQELEKIHESVDVFVDQMQDVCKAFDAKGFNHSNTFAFGFVFKSFIFEEEPSDKMWKRYHEGYVIKSPYLAAGLGSLLSTKKFKTKNYNSLFNAFNIKSPGTGFS